MPGFYKEIWLVDFEFRQPPGERVTEVHCLVAYEVRSGRLIRLWRDEFGPEPPYSTGPDTLFVAYYAAAELNCHLALGWPMPERILDLCIEFKALTSNLKTRTGEKSLIDALEWFGFEHMEAIAKRERRDLAIRGGPFTNQEHVDLTDYCECDVRALELLFQKMLPGIDIPTAVEHGSFMRTIAKLNWNGIPVNVPALTRVKQNWFEIKRRLILSIDQQYHVYRADG